VDCKDRLRIQDCVFAGLAGLFLAVAFDCAAVIVRTITKHGHASPLGDAIALLARRSCGRGDLGIFGGVALVVLGLSALLSRERRDDWNAIVLQGSLLASVALVVAVFDLPWMYREIRPFVQFLLIGL
jgi:hypothetical protein